MVVLSTQHRSRSAALPQCNLQRFAQVRRTFLGYGGKRLAAPGIDELYYTNQFVCPTIDYRCHQHLLGAKSGALVDFFEEFQIWVMGTQLVVVVNIPYVDQLPG